MIHHRMGVLMGRHRKRNLEHVILVLGAVVVRTDMSVKLGSDQSYKVVGLI